MQYILKKYFGLDLSLSFYAIHAGISNKLEKYGIDLVRIALAIVFIWFGALKIVGMSPAQALVEKTIFWFPPKVAVIGLGFWEVAIGLGLMVKRFVPYTLILLLLHMIGTFLPMVILTNICFDGSPLYPTMEGQYILKNLVLVAGALSVAGKYKLIS